MNTPTLTKPEKKIFKGKLIMTTYKIIPGKQSEVCGVTYAQAIATFDNGHSQEVTKRKSELLLLEHLQMLQKKYKIKPNELNQLIELVQSDSEQSKAESEIDQLFINEFLKFKEIKLDQTNKSKFEVPSGFYSDFHE